MRCEWVAEHLDAYELGCLAEADRRAFEAHLASCAGCRALLAEARAADEAVRAALAWAEPSQTFAARVLSRARGRVLSPGRIAAGAVAAAAAVAICLALLRGPGKQGEGRVVVIPKDVSPVGPEAASGRLLAGEVYDGYGLPARRLVPGRPYAAAEPAALSVDAGSLLLMAGGSQFAPAPAREAAGPGVSVLAGSVVGHVGSRGKELAIELAPELGGAIVRTTGCEFYSSGFPAHRLAAGLPFPAGALAHWPGDIRVHVFGGRLDLDLGLQKLPLVAGDSAIISGGVSAGTARAVEERAGELRAALGEDRIRERQLYALLCEEYARRLLQLRAMTARDGLSYLPERLALVEGLLRDHAAALARLEADHPEFLEWDAATAELDRLERVHEEAEHALDRFLALLDPAG